VSFQRKREFAASALLGNPLQFHCEISEPQKKTPAYAAGVALIGVWKRAREGV
jgi:hypothetical protein